MKRNRVRHCAGLFLLVSVAAARSFGEEPAKGISIIPKPMKVEQRDGSFVVRAETGIFVEKGSTEVADVGKYLTDVLGRATGYPLNVSDSDEIAAAKGAILLTRRGARDDLGNEGYELTVGPDAIVLRAPKTAGLFYGVQTLRQLLPPEIEGASPAKGKVAWAIPCVQIVDQPRFEWRGLLVDSARHFFPKESLKKFIGLMALHKFNILQVHFTDDQSWTLQIDACPKLTEVGARGGPYAINGTWLGVGKGIGSGRYYTKDDVREIVQYAADRHITIVPEIEMPAHAASWLAAYPELLCASHAKFPAPEVGKPGDATQRVVWSAYRELCLGNEATYRMVEKILAEVSEMFPGPYLHIGGDEASKFGWKQCDLCQARMKAEGLKDERELQSYFIRRVGKFIESRGRKFVGWDEIMQGGLAPNAIVMSWTGVAPGQAAVKAGHDVVFSPTSHCYFDYGYDRIPTEKVYSFEPLESLNSDEAKRVKGVQGNLWSEWIPDLNRLEYMAFPRACALAEVAWSPTQSRNWQDFQKRMTPHRVRLDALNVNYCREVAPIPPKPGR